MKDLSAIELLELYEKLISEKARNPKTFKKIKELEEVYNEVFKRIWEYY
jgi:hypothetical protein